MKTSDYTMVCAFYSLFESTPPFKKNELIVKGKRLFLAKYDFDEALYSGEYLGDFRRGTFIPSMHLIRTHLDNAKYQVTLGQKAAWLFMCGRDVFSQSVKESLVTNKHVLVRDQEDVIGFGISHSGKVVIENKRDIGEYLRREMTQN